MLKKIFLTGAFLAIALFNSFSQVQHYCSAAKSKSNAAAKRSAVSAQHTQLMNQYDVHYYKLDVALERTSTFIRGNVTVKAISLVQFLDTFGLELHPNLTIDSVKANGILQTVLRNGNAVSIPLTQSVPQGLEVSIQVFYKGTPPSGGFFAGLSNDSSPRWGNQATWSLSQPFSAYEWWPCKQVLTDKADSLEVWITTDNTNKAGSNGLLKQVVGLPNNKARYEWKSNYPISYYLVSVAVARYVDYSTLVNIPGLAQPVLFQNYIYDNPQTLPTFQNDIDEAADMMIAFSELFGPYPFHEEKYGHCMAPLSGGMEHQTMTTQGFFEFTLTAHELVHQWFGDYITCASWEDIWLNEGFASYGEYLGYEQLYSRAVADNYMLDVHDNVMSQPGGSVYVSNIANESRIFSSRLSYDKGSTLVHTLRYLVNNDVVFFAALRKYLDTYKFGNVTTQQLLDILNAETGIDFTDFKQQLFYGEGFPTYNLIWNYESGLCYIEINQTTSSSATTIFTLPVELRLNTLNGDTIIRVTPTTQNSRFAIVLPDQVTDIEVDPFNGLVNRDVVQYDSGLTFQITGIENTNGNASAVILFPNPATDAVSLVFSTPNSSRTITLNDVSGKNILNTSAPNEEFTLNINHLPKGVYVVKINDSNTKQTLRFIKY